MAESAKYKRFAVRIPALARTPDGQPRVRLADSTEQHGGTRAQAQHRLGPWRRLTYTPAAIQPLLLATHPSFPAKTVRELVVLAKARPGDVIYSSPGFGTNPQMGMELFLFMTGTRMLHVPYRGGGESIIAVVSGHVAVTVASMLGTMPQVRSGRLRALAVSTVSGSSVTRRRS